MYRPVPRALMMVFPTRAVPLKTPETVIDGWASLRGGIEFEGPHPACDFVAVCFRQLRTCRCTHVRRGKKITAQIAVWASPLTMVTPAARSRVPWRAS